MVISAYNNEDKIVEGEVLESKSGKQYVFYESTFIPISSLNHVRFIEEDENTIDKQVKADIESIKGDLKKKPVKAEDLEKIADERVKELDSAGIKEESPDEYKTKFVLQADAISSGSKNGVDTEAADPEKSEAFKSVRESIGGYKNINVDYHDVLPYEDDKTRDEIYLELNNEIKNSFEAKNRNDEELVEHLYKKFLPGTTPVFRENLKESLRVLNKSICITTIEEPQNL